MLQQLKLKHDELVNRAKALGEKEDMLTESESKEVEETIKEAELLGKEIENRSRIEHLETLGSKEHKAKVVDHKFEEHKRDFSIHKVMLKQMGVKVDTGLEDEVGDEIRSQSKHAYEGMPVPFSALQTRESTTANTGQLIATEHVGFIPALQETLVTASLGASVMTGLQGNIEIPRGGKLEATWLAEGGAPSETNPSFDNIGMTPKKAAILTGMSKFTLLQTSPSISQLAQNIMRSAVSRALDRVALIGGGSNEPTGILGGGGTQLTQSGTITNGKKLVYADLLALSAALNNADVGATSRGYCTNYPLANSLKQISRGVAATDNIPIMSGGQIADERTVLSNLVPADLSQGTARNANAIIYANWSDLIIGLWEDIDLVVNPYGAGFAAGKVQIRAMIVCDVALRHPQSAQYINTALA